MLIEDARAKVNLTLRVVGRRVDGYHDLESVVAFADCADRLSLAPGSELHLATTGPLAQACGESGDNLVFKAAELLAALAQVEAAGNPIARTYWRWRLTWNPFAIYQPASSAVGMYQMTDAAFAEAEGYCILHHAVVETGCSATALHSRVVPRHAAELTAVFLDRNLAAILGQRRTAGISRQRREELAAIIHLCGAGPAKVFVRRGFRLMPGPERYRNMDPGGALPRVV